MRISRYKLMLAFVRLFFYMVFAAAGTMLLLIAKKDSAKTIGIIFLALSLVSFVPMLMDAIQSSKLRKLNAIAPEYCQLRVGKVIGYAFHDQIKKLGRRMAMLEVLFFDRSGSLRMVEIPTDRVKVPHFPPDSLISFKIYKNEVALSGGEVSSDAADEFEERIKDVAFYDLNAMKGVRCPSCDAFVRMPKNRKARCPVCNQKMIEKEA